MSLVEMFSSLRQQAGIPFKLNEFGSCSLRHGELPTEMMISSVDRGASVLFHQGLRRPSPQELPEVLRHAMELNAYCAQTNGMTLGLDPKTGWIMLSRRMALADTSPDRLARWIAGFITTARDLHGRLQQIDAADKPTPEIDSNMHVLRI
jgi:Tir chaperone protein (CesT) family